MLDSSVKSDQHHPAGTNPVTSVVADVDGNGTEDIIVANQGSDDVTVSLTPVFAASQSYGAGCAGTGALIPVIAGSGPPTAGGSYAVTVSNGRPWARAWHGAQVSGPTSCSPEARAARGSRMIASAMYSLPAP